MTCSCESKLKDIKDNSKFLCFLYHNGNICIIQTNLEELKNLEKKADQAIENMKNRISIDRIIDMEHKCARYFMKELPAVGNLQETRSFNASYHIMILSKLGVLPQDFNNGIHLNGCELDLKLFK